MLVNDFIMEPDEYLTPSYRISPFLTEDIIINKYLSYSDTCDEYFLDRFKNRSFCYTTNGREAINIALSKLNLKSNDCVTIFTTTNNFYISGCVTKEIEKFCKWSRKIEKNTKVIFVNHEFGFPYENLMKLKNYNLPIIEDCAHSFNSNNIENSVGKVGDFVIFSFPKFFPIQIGGLLVYKKKYNVNFKLDFKQKNYIKKVISFYIDKIDDWSKARSKNYTYLNYALSSIGIYSRFKLKSYITPGVYMFKVSNNIDTDLLKKFLWKQGIQCSVFYKEKVMYIPVHNRLKKEDLDYFIECIKYFINTR
ncbi:DegT/DnrJ/EryC1/StrS family aminotransferase [Clostridium coskatii]|uniref:TDP-4-oxo-6-deoxy-D-glucose transaminase n=1 Tax=Clostridium coskatii TaxID=1705578 RepID=A0A170NNY9_9CLOT|nr:DegT/DnrJ/EryC1/StrS family aminotransferase [Clostridium coskatii]OAA94206.1 TDP-4-oxo-6-deoxy-D-glucose transaminase [Clostridium coskatii]OBR90922.1 TDP-4-oxo-6-deoxy-D-glucose transaminase [Clostridium coskatii]